MKNLQIRHKFTSSLLMRSFRVLDPRDRRRMIVVSIIQMSMSALDLIGVAAIGVLGALAINGVQSKEPGDRVGAVLNALQIGELSFQTQAAILGIGAAAVLIGKTVLSIFFTRRTLYFLSVRGAVLSSRLIAKLLSQPLLYIQRRNSQETLYLVTGGVSTILLGVIGTSFTMTADIALLVVIMVGLFIVDPSVAIATFLVFSVIGFTLYKLMHLRARTLGRMNVDGEIKSNEKILEVLLSYRESVVRNRRGFYVDEIAEGRIRLAHTAAELQFMPSISKYVVESTVVLGALAISGVQFIMQDASRAVGTLSVFLAAGMRIAPAVLRVQQGAIALKGSEGSAGPTLALMEELQSAPYEQTYDEKVDTVHLGFSSSVEISNLEITYPGKEFPAVTGVNLSISEGSIVAIVGPSGAGKTTLVDAILGVLIPDKGFIKISGMPPLEAVKTWPGACGYVPQDVMISNGTIRENIAMGFAAEKVSDDLISSSIEIAQLGEFISDLKEGVDTAVGERGAKISGGQRQRLGIARAMFTAPKLLVLDEATSALDGQTEADISGAIQNLKGRVTVIMIAHRLSTVRQADLVVYMEHGRVAATGTFEEVRAAISDFDNQAKLMGL
jgi:ABC-type multidrug transport system fused ATPase/permease subunit